MQRPHIMAGFACCGRSARPLQLASATVVHGARLQRAGLVHGAWSTLKWPFGLLAKAKAETRVSSLMLELSRSPRSLAELLLDLSHSSSSCTPLA